MSVERVAARVLERRRAVLLAQHYRQTERLTGAQIADRLGRSVATVRAYLSDPSGAKAKRVKDSYRGVCSRCGKATSGTGPRHARKLCGRCNGRLTAKWDRPRIERALRIWFETYGRPATSTDLSLTHARRSAARDGGVRLRRLQQGWAEGPWPAASVVQYHYGTVRAANQAALARPVPPIPEK